MRDRLGTGTHRASSSNRPEDDEVFDRCLRFGVRSADGDRWCLFLLERVWLLDLNRRERPSDLRARLCSTLDWVGGDVVFRLPPDRIYTQHANI